MAAVAVTSDCNGAPIGRLGLASALAQAIAWAFTRSIGSSLSLSPIANRMDFEPMLPIAALAWKRFKWRQQNRTV